MSERLLFLVLILGALVLLGWWLRNRPRALTARLQRGRGPSLTPPGRPVVLAFTSPECAACQAAQQPALAELLARAGDGVEVREVDVLTDRETARAYGIFSVPSTVVVAADGRVVAFNVGYAPANRLLAQLADARNGDPGARR